MKMVAKREGSDLVCYSIEDCCNLRWKIGTIRADGYYADRYGKDTEMEEVVNQRFHPFMPIEVKLAIVRECYEHFLAEQQAEAEAEQWAEGAWLRAAENAIPQGDLEYEEMCEAMDVGLMQRREAFWATEA